MRIIFLNSWFGKAGKPFIDFIKRERATTDIFCLMEFNEKSISGIFEDKDWNKFSRKGTFLESLNFWDENVIISRKSIDFYDSGSFNTTLPTKNETGIVEFVRFNICNKQITILNVHGISHPGTKLDTPARIKQSKMLIDFLQKDKNIKIVGGDFNLNPDTKSIQMIEEAGYRNLIKDFGIKNTRNKISWRMFNNIQYFADYCFVSPEVKVRKFEVPYMEISDHLPLILEFAI